MLPVAVARSSSDDNAISYSSGFVNDIIFSHSREYVAYREAYGRRLSVSRRQRKEGRSFSASASTVSALPPADWHPSAVSLAVHNGVWLCRRREGAKSAIFVCIV